MHEPDRLRACFSFVYCVDCFFLSHKRSRYWENNFFWADMFGDGGKRLQWESLEWHKLSDKVINSSSFTASLCFVQNIPASTHLFWKDSGKNSIQNHFFTYRSMFIYIWIIPFDFLGTFLFTFIFQWWQEGNEHSLMERRLN